MNFLAVVNLISSLIEVIDKSIPGHPKYHVDSVVRDAQAAVNFFKLQHDNQQKIQQETSTNPTQGQNIKDKLAGE